MRALRHLDPGTARNRDKAHPARLILDAQDEHRISLFALRIRRAGTIVEPEDQHIRISVKVWIHRTAPFLLPLGIPVVERMVLLCKILCAAHGP